MSRTLVNRRLAKAWMLEFADRNRTHKFTRVSPEVFDRIEGRVREFMRHIVDSQPSKGKTIK